MATSSRPFQSQTVARLVAGYRHIAHGAGRWLRQGRTVVVQGGLWGLQVVVYPIYAAVQGVRLGYRQLRASPLGQQSWAKLVGRQPPDLVGADTPIRALLSMIQPPTLSSSVVRSGGLSLVNRYGRWLRQSQAAAILTPGQWHRLPLGATVQGIATDLATRQLVLVTADNHTFDALTDDQQHRLQQAIALMVAEYARGCHQLRRNQHLQQPGLPLPQPQPPLFLPLRWIATGLRWMQTSTLAAATNLFGEATQQRESQTILTATTSVAEAVALVLASSGAVAETLAPELSPHSASAVLAVSGAQEANLPAAPQAAGRPTTGVIPPPEALAGSAQPLLADPNVLEVRVVQVNYVDHPLAALLRGLDWLLYELETWLRRLGAWLRQHW
ncbi:MAG: hypothetical protein EA368_07310 [Leptolyngbya sp. DLM2.Bin27]|nr:MAG: hypothetical protein EA368_07310 [Leptolyngbya sp. DLM2.Bin27]